MKKKSPSHSCWHCIQVELSVVLVGLTEDVHLEALVHVNRGSLGELVSQLCRSRELLYSHMSLCYPLTDLVCLDSDVPGLGP